MPAMPEKPATTPIPVQLSESEFTQFILPHLTMPKRGPRCKLGYHCVFNLILWVLYTGGSAKHVMLVTRFHGTVSQKIPPQSMGSIVAMSVRDACPACGSRQFKKNGHTHHGKQNHQCQACPRQFVTEATERSITPGQRSLVVSL